MDGGPPLSSELLSPLKTQNGFSLPNRIVMAPMTRCMAGDGLVPTEDMARYYACRARAGLIVSEATLIRQDGQGYPRTPGIWSPQQVEGWRRITAAVHREGGRIFCQLWHTGRAAHSAYHRQQTIAPSALALSGPLPRRRRLHYEMPRAMTREEISSMLSSFEAAAQSALAAGFDGVEIHGANGYLIDQFLHESSNQRTDEYGESPGNRARFALEVVDRVVRVWGSHRVGLRLSPGAHVNMQGGSRDADTFRLLLSELGPREIAYLHCSVFDDRHVFGELGERSSSFLRRHYPGTLIVGGSYDLETAEAAIATGQAEAVAFGRAFIANPDLVELIERRTPWRSYDERLLHRLA